MGRPNGRPPKPIEERRRIGNPSGRRLPDQGTLVELPAPVGPPVPTRPLAGPGIAMWNRVWTSGAVWLAERVDAEVILILCEQVDERADLRASVLANNDWRERTALRALEKQITDELAILGFNPVDRARLGVAEVKRVSALDALRARREAEAGS